MKIPESDPNIDLKTGLPRIAPHPAAELAATVFADSTMNEAKAPRISHREAIIEVCLRYNLPSIAMRDILEAAGETL